MHYATLQTAAIAHRPSICARVHKGGLPSISSVTKVLWSVCSCTQRHHTVPLWGTADAEMLCSSQQKKRR